MRRAYLIFGAVLFSIAFTGCGRYTKAQVTEYCRAHPSECKAYCAANPSACLPYLGGQSGSGYGGTVGTGGAVTGGVIGTGGQPGTGGTTETTDASPPAGPEAGPEPGPEPGPESTPDAEPVVPDAPPACVYSLTDDTTGCVSDCYQNQHPSGIADKTVVKLDNGSTLYMVMNGGHALVPITVQVAMQWVSDCSSPVVADSGYCQNVVTQIAAADVASVYGMTILTGVHVPPRPGTSVLTLSGNKYVDCGFQPPSGRVVLCQLTPPALEDLIFPGYAASIQQPIPPSEFAALYVVGTPITAAGQYDKDHMCVRTDDVIPESSFLFAPPPPPL